jgi:hypothetical protein
MSTTFPNVAGNAAGTKQRIDNATKRQDLDSIILSMPPMRQDPFRIYHLGGLGPILE